MATESKNGNKPYTNEEIKGIGNAVGDPRRISNANKMNVTVLRVAANSMALDREGNEIERVHYRELKLFGRDADNVLANIKKGDRVKYEGRLSPKEGYENKNGDFIEEDEVLVSMNGLTKVLSGGDGESGGRGRSRSGDDEGGSRSRPRSRSRSRSGDDEEGGSRGRSRGRSRDPEDDYDDEGEDFGEDDLDIEEESSKTPRSRSRRSRSKAVEADDDLEDYTSTVI